MGKPHALKNWRDKHGLSLADLGSQLGCGKPHVWRIENGHTEPSLTLLARISLVTGLPPKAFLPHLTRRDMPFPPLMKR
jgi:transcriptional regulator with XRE-family HTH domain